jgi:hypothetical protein
VGYKKTCTVPYRWLLIVAFKLSRNPQLEAIYPCQMPQRKAFATGPGTMFRTTYTWLRGMLLATPRRLVAGKFETVKRLIFDGRPGRIFHVAPTWFIRIYLVVNMDVPFETVLIVLYRLQ